MTEITYPSTGELTGTAILMRYREAQHRASLKPMRVGMWLKLCSTWESLRTTGQALGWGKPIKDIDLRLDGYYIRFKKLSPKGRHVHYQVLGKPGRRWMRTKQFLQAATVCGHFSRLPSGELVWIEPREPARTDVR